MVAILVVMFALGFFGTAHAQTPSGTATAIETSQATVTETVVAATATVTPTETVQATPTVTRVLVHKASSTVRPPTPRPTSTPVAANIKLPSTGQGSSAEPSGFASGPVAAVFLTIVMALGFLAFLFLLFTNS